MPSRRICRLPPHRCRRASWRRCTAPFSTRSTRSIRSTRPTALQCRRPRARRKRPRQPRPRTQCCLEWRPLSAPPSTLNWRRRSARFPTVRRKPTASRSVRRSQRRCSPGALQTGSAPRHRTIPGPLREYGSGRRPRWRQVPYPSLEPSLLSFSNPPINFPPNGGQRSADQTAVALFWSGNEVPMLNAAVRAAAQGRSLSVNDHARLFALLHMAGADATIALFKIKYAQNYWRPITAIRNAAGTGNGKLIADPSWEPLLVTPAHPEFPSGHATVTGAMAQVAREFLGSDEIKFSYVAPHGLGTMRSYASFTQIEKEMEDARVWAGIHFRSTDVESIELGRKIGAYAVASHMRPH